MTTSGRPAVVDGLALAAGTLTVLRVPAPSRVDRSRAAVAMAAAPMTVVPAGLAVAATGYASDAFGLPSLVAATLVIGVSALVTRALHLDGLADTADGLTSGYDRDRALEVMRRGDTGPAGVVALLLILVLQITACAAVLGHDTGWLAVALAWCGARCALTLCCVRGVPSARSEGLGAAVAGAVPRTALCGVLLAVAGAMAYAGAVVDRPWWQGPIALCLALAVTGLLLVRVRTRFGGITGDVLGAGVEIVLAVLLTALSAGQR